jgi:hypothetical protein
MQCACQCLCFLQSATETLAAHHAAFSKRFHFRSILLLQLRVPRGITTRLTFDHLLSDVRR